MNGPLAAFMVHTATVATCTGTTPTGVGYAAPVSVTGFLDDVEKVATESGGQQTVGQTVFYTDLADVDLYEPRSKFTCNGRDLVVMSTRRHDGGSILGQVSHLEVHFE